jgi:hypothetical protein
MMKKIILLFLFQIFFVFQIFAQLTLSRHIPLPAGGKREIATGFGAFVQNFPVSATAKVNYYNGEISSLDARSGGVLNIDIGNRDLMQCADAVMYIRALYLKSLNKTEDIAFHFVSGVLCEYKMYKKGYRFDGKNFVQSKPALYDDSGFEAYMRLVFAYASTLSLEKELSARRSWSELKVGDCFIRGGSPGHVFMVADKMQKNGKTYFAVIQGFMPAQNIHIVKNSTGFWYEAGKDYSNDIPYGELLQLKYLKSF